MLAPPSDVQLQLWCQMLLVRQVLRGIERAQGVGASHLVMSKVQQRSSFGARPCS